jgi:nucleoid DNA-binding protein
MRNLTKHDLVVRISNETGMAQQNVLDVIRRLLDHLTESLAHGQTVELRNFGVFEVKHRKARVGRNPRKPEHDVPIPPRAVVRFKSGKEMKAEVMNLASRSR